MGALDGLSEMLERSRRLRAADAERFAALDWDACQLCGAHGEDKRTLALQCFYAVHEVVPEAIQMADVPIPEDEAKEDHLPRQGYLLRICKSCRANFLGHLTAWRKECIARRGVPKDHDGHDEIPDPDRNIPVRVNGAIVMMTEGEYEAYNGPRR